MTGHGRGPVAASGLRRAVAGPGARRPGRRRPATPVPPGEGSRTVGRRERAAASGGSVGAGSVRRRCGRGRRGGLRLWYELESHALGLGGPTRGRRRSTAGSRWARCCRKLSADHVIGSRWPFASSIWCTASPTIVPGDYLLHQNEGFSQVHAILGGGPNIVAVTVDPWLDPARGGRSGSTTCPGTRVGWVRQGGRQRRRALGVLARRVGQPRRACWARGPIWCCRGRPTPPS